MTVTEVNDVNYNIFKHSQFARIKTKFRTILGVFEKNKP